MIYANESALQISGMHKLENILGLNLFENLNLAPKMEELFKEGIVKFQSLLNFENINNDCCNLENSKKTFLDWTVSLVDSGFLVQIQDISESKEVQELLEESEEKYRRWFEDDLTGDFIATPKGKILECNPAFVDIYRFNGLQKAIGSYISQFNMSDWINLIDRIKSEGKIQGYQSWHRQPNGNEIHVVANVVGIFNDNAELVQVKGYVFDDTERKIAEESLQESEEKYHRLFDEDLTGDFIATIEGEIIECNPAFAEIYGFNDCKIATKWNISESNPFDWPYMVTRLKKERKILGFQSWQRRYDGRKIHVIANVVGIFNDDRELVQVKGYFFDDTERKIAEDELTRSKRQITEILDSIKDNFVALNPQWHFIYVNKSAGEYFSVDPDDIIGRSIWERFPEFIGTTYETAFHKAMENKEIQHFEAPDIHTDDQQYDFSVYPSDEGISVFWRDITKRKKV
ncbi:PAS domain S-box-containing protein [Methanobacterium oryzae]